MRAGDEGGNLKELIFNEVGQVGRPKTLHFQKRCKIELLGLAMK